MAHFENRLDTVSPQKQCKTQPHRAEHVTIPPLDVSPTMAGLERSYSVEGLHGGGGTDYICLWDKTRLFSHLK